MLESHSEIFIEATVRRTIVIHTADRFKIELPGIISLRNLLLAAARLEASTPPPQALPLQSGIPEWERSGGVPNPVCHAWLFLMVGSGRNEKQSNFIMLKESRKNVFNIGRL